MMAHRILFPLTAQLRGGDIGGGERKCAGAGGVNLSRPGDSDVPSPVAWSSRSRSRADGNTDISVISDGKIILRM